TWARWCGAQVAVLVALSADGALADVYTAGRSAQAISREISDRQMPPARGTVIPLTLATHAVLLAPLSAAAAVNGWLALAVRHPRRFDAIQRGRLVQLIPVARVALQLKARGERNTPPPRSDSQRRLNRRERDVVGLLVRGHSAKETAAQL